MGKRGRRNITPAERIQARRTRNQTEQTRRILNASYSRRLAEAFERAKQQPVDVDRVFEEIRKVTGPTHE